MTPASVKPLTLEEFLKLPYIEKFPAWKYINGDAIQKSMPKTSARRRKFVTISQRLELTAD